MDESTLTAPERCNGCGLKTKNMESKGQAWIMVRLAIPGMALFGCSKCHSVFMNTDALANIKSVKKRQANKIQVVPNMGHVNQTFKVQDN